MRGTFYRKSFIWFLLTASIPGLITGVFIYTFSKAQIEQDLSDLHQKQIDQRVKNIDDQLSYLELDLSHWAFHSRFGWELADLDFVYYFQETWDISRTLNIMQGSHPLIDNVVLYVDQKRPVLFRTEYRQPTEEEIALYRTLLSDRRNVYWQYKLADKKIRLVHQVPGVGSPRYGVLAVTIQADKLVNLLKTMTPYNEGITFLMDRDGYVIATDSPQGGQDVHHALRESILNHRKSGQGEERGTFLWEWNDMTYSVSYGNMKRIESDWTYVSAAPITTITAPVVRLSNIIIIVSLSVLLLGLMLSWVASNWIYSPIRRLLNKMTVDAKMAVAADPQLKKLDEFQFLESQWSSLADQRLTLEKRLNEQMHHLRNSFLLQLIQGHLYAYSEEDLQRQMERYGWNVDQHRYYILLFQLTGFDSLKGRFSAGDEALVTFVAFNIIEELAKETFQQFGVMNFHNLSVAMFLISHMGEDEREKLRVFGDRTAQQIHKLLGLNVTITVSRAIGHLRETPEAYMEVERFSGYRKFSNQYQFIRIDEIPTHAIAEDTSYPFAKEQDVLQALRSGKQNEAEKYVAQFLDELLARQDTEIYVQQGMLQLLGSIQHMILQSRINIFHLYEGENLFEHLSQIREPNKMLTWMQERVIRPYMKERESRASRQLKEMVDQTVDYIHQNYMNDISLDKCAELVGTNSYTLSRLFKQTTGVNFIDYVTNIRIEKAKELLLQPNKRIHEIAAEVGYQQRYFNRIFKKHVGVTPGQYREISLQALQQSKN